MLSCVGECLAELGIADHATDRRQPGYPRFDLTSRWHVLKPDVALSAQRHDDALRWTGGRLREFRHDGDAERSTESYRQIVRPFLDGAAFTAEFRAGALGLPIVYTQRPENPGDEARSATVEPVVGGQPSRRASPLWLRVHHARGRWWLRSLAFDATWLPETGAELRIKATKGASREPKPVRQPSPALIRQELDRWFTFITSAVDHCALSD